MTTFCEWSGAKECQSDRSRQELSNEYLVAKIGFDTAENEPLKVWITDHTLDHIPSLLPCEIWLIYRSNNMRCQSNEMREQSI